MKEVVSVQAQMNIRIDSKLRERGNLAFASVGVSPSQAVRALWSFAAEHCDDPQAITKELQRMDGSSDSHEIKDSLQKLDKLNQIIAQIEEFGSRENDEAVRSYVNKPLDELRGDHLFERLTERGLAK